MSAVIEREKNMKKKDEGEGGEYRKIKALFGWSFGFGFWPQKPKAQPKGLLLEGAFSKAAAFP